MFSVRYTGRRKRNATRYEHDPSLVEGSTHSSSPSSPPPRPYIRAHNPSAHSLHVATPHHVDIPNAIPRSPASLTSSPSSPLASPSSGPGNRHIPSSPSLSPLADAQSRLKHGFAPTYAQPSGVASSLSSPQSSYPPTPRSRSTTESDIQFPQASRRGNMSGYLRPSTAPHPPSHAFHIGESGFSDAQTLATSPETWSRFAMGMKSLLSKPAQPSSAGHSHYSTPSGSETSLPAQRMARMSRPPDLHVAACPTPPPQVDTPSPAHHRHISDAKKMLAPTVSCVPVAKQESRDSPGFKIPRGREQRPRNVLRRRPSGSAKSLKEKRDKMASPADEKRRSFDLDDRPPVPPKPEWSYKNSGSAPQTPTTPVVQTRALREDGNADSPLFDSPIQTQSQANQFVEHPSTPLHVSRRSPTPHYTVYGTPAERRIPACGPDDCWTGPDVLIPPEQRRRPKTHTHVRTLSRKVSAQWKKVTGGIVASDNSPSPLGHKTGHSKGRPSLQEWSRGRSKERTRFTGRSMDGLAALSGEDEVWAGSAAVRERSFTDPSAEQTESKDSEGGKLWRLVKRISTGSLRERVNAEKDHAVPPLPAIPRELLHRASHGGHSKQSVDTTAPKARVLPPSSRRRRSSSLDKQPGVQSSIATSSSSPNSSDVASTKFFPRPYSARSSISSYGEVEMPRVTELDRHIISPLEQLRLGGDIEPGADITPSRSPRRRSASVPPGPPNDANIDRPLCSAVPPAGLGDTSTGSASNHTLLADGGVSLSPPPPRPPHARLRTSNGSGPGSPTSSKHVGERVSEVSIHTRISSTGRDSLEQSYFRAQMTFRELNAPRRPPLTEREKSDIWENLLARSEQAGGTLHISGGELMSDSLRLSTYSEMSLKSVCDVPSQRTSLSP